MSKHNAMLSFCNFDVLSYEYFCVIVDMKWVVYGLAILLSIFLSFRKYCTVYDGEPWRTNYNATKTRPFEGGTVYKFPEDLDKLKLCEQSMLNK